VESLGSGQKPVEQKNEENNFDNLKRKKFLSANLSIFESS
jgi:hypothetical protein